MAKELPYFKFEPSEWDSGNIQMLSREDKGLFMDLCSLYWVRLGDLPTKLALRKICDGNAAALDSLCDEEIISIEDGKICIDFLNEQLLEFDNTRKQNSKNARDGWKKRLAAKNSSGRNAIASKSQSESDAIREEEIKEDKIKVDWDSLLKIFNNITKKNSRVISAKTRKQILSRLKEGYSKEDLIDAITNCYNDEFHSKNNHKYLTLEFISRSDKLESWVSASKRELTDYEKQQQTLAEMKLVKSKNIAG